MQFQRPRAAVLFQTHHHFIIASKPGPFRYDNYTLAKSALASPISPSPTRTYTHLPVPSFPDHVNQPPQQKNSPRIWPARATKTLTFPTARPPTPKTTPTAEATAPRAAITLGDGVEAPAAAAGARQAGYYVALGVGVCGLVCGCCCYAACGYGEGGDGGGECVVEEEAVVRIMEWDHFSTSKCEISVASRGWLPKGGGRVSAAMALSKC